MAFKISVTSGHPNFETLPAAKVTSYPLAKEDYRPFAQARFLMGSEGLYLQLIAFEVTVSEKSRLQACFMPVENSPVGGERWISLIVGEKGIDSFTVWQDGSILWQDNEAAAVTPIHGEDLQGIYWGVQALIPYETMLRIWPNFACAAGETIRGNIFKTCDDPDWEHYGSFFPADFALEQPYGPANFGEFLLVNY